MLDTLPPRIDGLQALIIALDIRRNFYRFAGPGPKSVAWYCVCYLVFKPRFLDIAFAIWSFVASRRCNLSYLALTLLCFSLAIQIILLQFVGLWLIILASLLRLFCRFLCLFRLFPLLLFLAWFLFDSSTNDDIYARLLSVFSSHFILKPPPNICIRSSTTPMINFNLMSLL